MELKQKLQMTQEAFIELFENGLKKSMGVKEAYEATEELHEIMFGSRRYSGFKSFEMVRNRALKMKRP